MARTVKYTSQIVKVTAGISKLPFASQARLSARQANTIVPVKLNSLSNFNLKSKYIPMLPTIAKIPVTIKIATLSTYPKSKIRDVKKQTTGDRYMDFVECIFVPA